MYKYFTLFFLISISCISSDKKKYQEKVSNHYLPYLSVEERTKFQNQKFSVDKTYVINLLEHKSADTRWEKIKKNFKEAQWEYNITRFPGIYGKNFFTEAIKDLKPNQARELHYTSQGKKYSTTYTWSPEIKYMSKYPLSTGELGNYLSHYHVWKDIDETNQNLALVLEDDAELVPFFKSKVASIVEHAPKDWDILYLFCHQTDLCSPSPENNPITPDQRFEVLNKPCIAGNVSYLVNLTGVRKMLKKALPLEGATDYYMQSLFADPDFHAYCSFPEIIEPGTAKSIIDESGRNTY